MKIRDLIIIVLLASMSMAGFTWLLINEEKNTERLKTELAACQRQLSCTQEEADMWKLSTEACMSVLEHNTD